MRISITLLSPAAFQQLMQHEKITDHYVLCPAGLLRVSMCSLGIFNSEFVDEKSNHILDAIDQNVPLVLVGTPFQLQVWQRTLQIKKGTTQSYNQLASALENPKAYRAIARALGANKIAYFVPCHRVIGSNGSLTGFKWGLDKKRLLLQNEQNLF